MTPRGILSYIYLNCTRYGIVNKLIVIELHIHNLDTLGGMENLKRRHGAMFWTHVHLGPFAHFSILVQYGISSKL